MHGFASELFQRGGEHRAVRRTGWGAYAATGGSFEAGDGTIAGCVAKKGGPLDVYKPGHKCPKGKTPLVFNAKGQKGNPGASGSPGAKGDPGAIGPQGVKGDTGAVGPSDAYYASDDTVTPVTQFGAHGVSVTVPAGSYTSTANALFGGVTMASVGICTLSSADDSTSGHSDTAAISVDANGQAEDALETAFAFPSGGTITESCNNYFGTTGAMNVLKMRLIATKVGTLH